MLMILGLSQAWAQRQISGQVTADGNGSSLPGINVLVQNTTVGTVTDIDGNYSISVTGDNPVLTFSSIGYASQLVEVNGRSTINVVMQEDVQQLGEVVVTALGVERETKALQYSLTKSPVKT